MYIYICILVYLYIFIYVYIYRYVHIYICIYKYVVYLYIYKPVLGVCSIHEHQFFQSAVLFSRTLLCSSRMLFCSSRCCSVLPGVVFFVFETADLFFQNVSASCDYLPRKCQAQNPAVCAESLVFYAPGPQSHATKSLKDKTGSANIRKTHQS